MGDLKPCPFCGGGAILSDAEAGTGGLPRSARNPRCSRCGMDHGYYDTPQAAAQGWNRRISDAEIERLTARVATLERMDREAATHVETEICMRTGFTGDPPYVGWKGLGLALTEALDERDALRARAEAAEAERDRLRAECARLVEYLKETGGRLEACKSWPEPGLSPDECIELGLYMLVLAADARAALGEGG